MTGLKMFAVAALLALSFTATARAGDCVIGGGQGPCQSTSPAVSPREVQLADEWAQGTEYIHARTLGCVMEACTYGKRDYACTYYYTDTVKQCSTCCSLEAETKGHMMKK